jgi:hypothetical protein
MADRRQANDKIEIIIMLMTMKNPQARGQARGSEISTDGLRLKFDRVLKAVKQGRTLTLTYRNKPLPPRSRRIERFRKMTGFIACMNSQSPSELR